MIISIIIHITINNIFYVFYYNNSDLQIFIFFIKFKLTLSYILLYFINNTVIYNNYFIYIFKQTFYNYFYYLYVFFKVKETKEGFS